MSSPFNLIYSAGSAAAGVFLEKHKANKVYREIHPVLINTIKQRGRNSPDAK
ncbi:hypothetical protein [Thalassotalea euphylliae]|uniref:hypothetical protein n=1 Tax=Thalassotalea euphylliae TaxID=1655234 RepID=UPI0015F27598|nr:hypothetical protein [Thalassotalea euphylliae]